METIKEIEDFWQAHPCGAELVGDLSDESKQAYVDFFSRYDEFRYRTESHILKNLDRFDFQGKRVLEIGLGQGADSEQLVRRGAIYSGIDLTEEAVKRTKMRLSLSNLTSADVRQASALEIPFPENSFDIVYSHGVLHHVPDIKKAQKEIARVLKPDGRLIVMLYAKRSINYWISIFTLRRLGLLAIYFLGLKVGGIYRQHLENAKEKGIWNYLKMDNIIHVNTDGPLNPYSKVYDLSEVKNDFSDFTVTESHQEFMHAPPLKIGRLPLARWFGWHLWVTMRPKR